MYRRYIRNEVDGKLWQVFGMRAEAEEIYRTDAEPVIRNLALEHRVSEDEMESRLLKSDIEHPIEYRDEVFWAEVLYS